MKLTNKQKELILSKVRSEHPYAGFRCYADEEFTYIYENEEEALEISFVPENMLESNLDFMLVEDLINKKVKYFIASYFRPFKSETLVELRLGNLN
jgi:hypothetical protein